jgi:hypothetical protein
VALSNGTISANKAKTAGGGICLEGEENATQRLSMNVNGCTLTENEATDGNGGGIFLSNADMTYSGGLLAFNKAIYGTSEAVKFYTGYLANANEIKGVGGGIYISTNSGLKFGNFTSLGVYANTADISADDLFANGNKTSLLLPNIANMSLQDYAGNADGLGWYEDYIENDSQYNIAKIAKGDHPDKEEYKNFRNRFRTAQQLGSTFMRLYEVKNPESITLSDHYVSLALGFLFSDLTIRVEGLKPGESCIFNVQGTAENGKYRYQVPVYGTSNQYDEQKIIKLPVDKYTVTLMQNWPWAYNEPAISTITKMNSTDGGIYEFTLTHKQTSITHDEKNVSIKLQ